MIPGDADALKSKLVALIKQSAIKRALELIASSTSELGDCTFEKAYCLFRMQKLDDVMTTLSSAESTDESAVNMIELKAQVLYRQEKYADATANYKVLMASHDDDYTRERSTNMFATYAGSASAAKDPSEVVVENDEPVDTHEQCYNLATVALSKGNHGEALKLLTQSQELCRTMLEQDEDYTEEEIEDELMLLQAQTGVALLGLGRDKEAAEVFTQILKAKPDDEILSAVAAVNLVALNKDRSVFDSRKKMALVDVDALANKLTKAQKEAIGTNNLLLLLHMNQPEACAKKLKELEGIVDADVLCMIQASLYHRGKKTELALESLKSHAAANPTSSTQTTLAIAQMHLLQGQTEEAIALLAGVAELQGKPGMVGALVTLHSLNDEPEKAAAVLDEALANSIGEANEATFLQAAADFKYDNKMFKEAGALYQKLFEANSEDGVALTKLITCLTEYDMDSAERYTEQLPPFEVDESEVNIDVLEKAKRGVRKTMAKAEKADAAGPADVAKVEAPKRARKKRPGKLPKNYNPNIPPDAERWLPVYERMEYKRKHRKKAGLHYQVGRGTQGTETAGVKKITRVVAGGGGESAAATSPTGSPPPSPTKAAPTMPKEVGGGGAAAAAAAAAKKKKKKTKKKK
jgi:signal recognition particle subunit SRP72